MNRLALVALAAGLAATTSPATASTGGEWTSDEHGDLLLAPFDNAPFPHASRANGHTRGDKVYPAAEHYSDATVAVFIPRGWRDGATIDLVYYFHGHGNHVRQSIEEARLREQVIASGRNVVLVFPQGPRNASDSSCGKLEEPDGLKKLTTEVIDRLRADGKTTATGPGRVVLSGHSGAYLVIGKALDHGGLDDHIAEVYLLDATYGQFDAYAGWMERHPEGRLRSIFTEHLAPENVTIMAMIDAKGIDYALRLDADATREGLLRDTPRVFIHTTTRDHNACRELLGPWLGASTLDPIVGAPNP